MMPEPPPGVAVGPSIFGKQRARTVARVPVAPGDSRPTTAARPDSTSASNASVGYPSAIADARAVMERLRVAPSPARVAVVDRVQRRSSESRAPARGPSVIGTTTTPPAARSVVVGAVDHHPPPVVSSAMRLHTTTRGKATLATNSRDRAPSSDGAREGDEGAAG
jgi:hypothetical protein